jgi:hypothetical protein
VKVLADQYCELVSVERDTEAQEMLDRVQEVILSNRLEEPKPGTNFADRAWAAKITSTSMFLISAVA